MVIGALAGLLLVRVVASWHTAALVPMTRPRPLARSPPPLLQRPTAALPATAPTRMQLRRPAMARPAALAAHPATVGPRRWLAPCSATRCCPTSVCAAVPAGASCPAVRVAPPAFTSAPYAPLGPAAAAAGAPGAAPQAAPQAQWQELHDDQGRPYYYNPSTGVTQVGAGPLRTVRFGAGHRDRASRGAGQNEGVVGRTTARHHGWHQPHQRARHPPNPTLMHHSPQAALLFASYRTPHVRPRCPPLPAVGEAPRHVSSSSCAAPAMAAVRPCPASPCLAGCLASWMWLATDVAPGLPGSMRCLRAAAVPAAATSQGGSCCGTTPALRQPVRLISQRCLPDWGAPLQLACVNCLQLPASAWLRQNA